MATTEKSTPVDDDERAYEKLADRTREQLHQGIEVAGDALSSALERAVDSVQATGEFTSEQIDRTAKFLKRDLAHLHDSTGRTTAYIQKAANATKVGSGFLSLASDALESASDALESLGEKLDRTPRYKTGDVTGPGTLTCTSCETELGFKASAKIPPCGKCHGTEFTKSYKETEASA